MAEEKEKPKKEEKQEAKSQRDSLFDHAMDQLERQLTRPVARWIVRNIPDPLADWGRTWEAAFPFVSIALSYATPDAGIWRHIDHFQQDLFAKVQEELQTPTQKTPEDDVIEQAAANAAMLGTAEFLRICKATDNLDQQKRDAFFTWFQNLSEEKKNRFYELVSVLNDAELKHRLELLPQDLERQIDAMPARPTPQKPMSLIALRAAVNQDAALSQAVNDFLTRSKQDSNKFWKAVEKRVKTVEELRNLVSLPDPVITSMLKLDSKSPLEHLSGTWKGLTEAVSTSLDDLTKKLDQADTQYAQEQAVLMQTQGGKHPSEVALTKSAQKLQELKKRWKEGK